MFCIMQHILLVSRMLQAIQAVATARMIKSRSFAISIQGRRSRNIIMLICVGIIMRFEASYYKRCMMRMGVLSIRMLSEKKR